MMQGDGISTRFTLLGLGMWLRSCSPCKGMVHSFLCKLLEITGTVLKYSVVQEYLCLQEMAHISPLPPDPCSPGGCGCGPWSCQSSGTF